MKQTIPLYKRVFPAALTTSVFFAFAFALTVTTQMGLTGGGFMFAAAVIFVIAMIVASIGGFFMLAIVDAFKLKPIVSLIIFIVFIPAVTTSIYKAVLIDSMSLYFGIISVMASLIAWYLSVYRPNKISKRQQVNLKD